MLLLNYSIYNMTLLSLYFSYTTIFYKIIQIYKNSYEVKYVAKLNKLYI